MYSIEGEYCKPKLEFNKPYSCISILHGHSSDMLSSIDLSKPSIIWLDYDNVLSMDIFTDLELVLHAIPRGSIYIMSCNRQLRKDKEIPYSNDELRGLYGSLVPFDIPENCCTDANSSYTIKKMIDNHCTFPSFSGRLYNMNCISFDIIYSNKLNLQIKLALNHMA